MQWNCLIWGAYFRISTVKWLLGTWRSLIVLFCLMSLFIWQLLPKKVESSMKMKVLMKSLNSLLPCSSNLPIFDQCTTNDVDQHLCFHSNPIFVKVSWWSSVKVNETSWNRLQWQRQFMVNGLQSADGWQDDWKSISLQNDIIVDENALCSVNDTCYINEVVASFSYLVTFVISATFLSKFSWNMHVCNATIFVLPATRLHIRYWVVIGSATCKHKQY